MDQGAERGWFEAPALALRMMKSLATPIALGSLAALALRTRASKVIELALGQRWSAPLTLGLVIAGAVLPWSILSVHLLMTALVVSVCLREDHWLAPILSSRPFRHVGVVSYGIYLVNVPCVQLARRFADSTLDVFVLGLGFSVALASVTYVLIERPFLALRERSPSLTGDSPASA